jgi:Protein of unknown function (DUF3052)
VFRPDRPTTLPALARRAVARLDGRCRSGSTHPVTLCRHRAVHVLESTRSVAEKDYSHRDVVDKLGIKPGFAVAFADEPLAVDAALRARVLDRTGRGPAAADEPVDVALIGANDSTEVETVLQRWRQRIDQAGGIWLLTPKRGQPGYVDQRDLILAGPGAGVVDNKICSVSDTLSGMRFVIRKSDRVYS